MGGIAVKVDLPDSVVPNVESVTLAPHGLMLLLKHEPHLLPDISREDVKDRSKGSSLTKFLACIQATWFCLSIFVRIGQRLPVSLLELNTFAHAFCTVIVYALVRRIHSIALTRNNADAGLFEVVAQAT